MRCTFIIILVALFQWSAMQAQVTFQPRKLSNEDRGIVYSQELATDFRLQTNGWSAGVSWGNLKTYYLTRYYYADFGERKHLKELRFKPGINQNSYIFGKENNLFVLRAGIGEKRYLTEKAAKKGVAVGFSYRAGPAIGLLKPYYLDITITETINTTNTTRPIKYSAETENEFLDQNRIVGNSGLLKGWGEVRPTIGAQAMGALHLSWGAYEEYVKAIEAGVMVDLFFSDVPILVENSASPAFQNKPFFVNVFVNFQFGRRK